ncbi:MAG: penicillin-binding protein 1A [Chromatiaceae bacterium]
MGQARVRYRGARVNRRRRRPLTRLGLMLASGVALGLNLAAAGLLGVGILIATTLADLPRTDSLREVRLQEPMRVFSADGVLMAEFGAERRQPVPYAEVPPRLVDAFLATEDNRFFQHEGVDLIGLGRAALSFLQTGERSQGGSTITMQVARNFYLSPEKTFRRKLSELLLSLHIERTLTKQEILELYFNKIFFGHRAYGISAAADIYYGKTLRQLTLAQVAMLAGIPKAPSANNPVSNPKRALERRDYILGRMRELGYISPKEYQEAVAALDTARLARRPIALEAGYVSEMVRRDLVARYGEEAAYGNGFQVTTTLDSRLQREAEGAVHRAVLDYDQRHGYRGAEAKHKLAGLSDEALDTLLEKAGRLPELTAALVLRAGDKEAEVYLGQGKRAKLTLSQMRWASRYRNEDAKGAAPSRVAQVVATGDLIRLRKTAGGGWELSQAPHVSGALSVLDPTNGALLALVGGYDFQDSKFNRALDARRQPGSSFKPFVYAAALDQGWTPASLLQDKRLEIRVNKGKVWRPDNFDGKTMGPIRLRLALIKSRNLASVWLLREIGLDSALDFVTRFGFDSASLPHGLTLVLGTAAASPTQMAAAYAVFANGGFRVIPHFMDKILDGNGTLVFAAKAPRACSDCWFRYPEASAGVQALGSAGGPAPEAPRVLDPRVVWQMNSIMGDVIRQGTGRKALELKREDIAGKTGTTNEVRDSWFCGYQKDLVAVSWMGFDDFSPLGKGETGGQAALGLWVDFMGQALAGKPEATLEVPAGLTEVRVAKSDGRLTRKTGDASLPEWVRQEDAQTPEGPAPTGETQEFVTEDPGYYERRKPTPSGAPRLIDDLF